jgi:LysM repeat protein
MKIKIIYILLIYLIISGGNLCFAQTNNPIDTTTKVINGKTFYVHKVLKNETLYGLAHDYNVTVKEITEANPRVANGLKAGNNIYIPFKFHKNDALSHGDKNADTAKDKPFDPSKETFQVALLLPLNFPVYGEKISSDTSDTFFDKTWNANTVSSLEFYEGVLFSLDSLKKHGLHLELNTYSVKDDSLEVMKLLEKPEMKKMNLIIGPLFNQYANKVAGFAKTNKIPLIYPFTNNSSLTENNPYVFTAIPCNTTQVKLMANYVSENFGNDNLLILSTNNSKEKEIDSIYTKVLEKPWENSGNKHVVKHVNFYDGGLEKKNNLDTGGKNIFIVNTQEEAVVSEMISKLNTLAPDYEILLIGIPKWESYETLDIDYLQNLDFHWFTSTFINQDDSAVKIFREVYRDKYRNEPSVFVFKGYDIMTYFGNAFLRYGNKFDSKLTEFKMNGLSTNFNFKKTGELNGFENEFINIVKYEDFQLKKVLEKY